MTKQRREIGPIGTVSRLVVGLFLLYIAFVDGPPLADGFEWGLRWYDVVVGAVALPAIMLGFGLAARGYAPGDVRFMGVPGTLLNGAVLVALANPYTGGGAALFYGATILIAATRGQAGCEGTVLSNWVLRRNDQIGCPAFTPIDLAEARFRRSHANTIPAGTLRGSGKAAPR
jgi:hypothetical protein